jgi:hypothetical protein
VRALSSLSILDCEKVRNEGKYSCLISNKIEAAEWGDGTVDELAQYAAKDQPNVRCFA